MKKIMQGMLFAIIWLSACAISAWMPVWAGEVLPAEDLDEAGDLTLTVSLTIDDSAVSGIEVSIYRIAELSTEYGNVTYTPLIGDEDYAGMTARESEAVSSELTAMIEAYDLSAYQTQTTDAQGDAVYTGLLPGMYLVLQTSEDDYGFDSFMVSVPEAYEDGDVYAWNEDVVCSPKAAEVSVSTDIPSGTTTNVKTSDPAKPVVYAGILTVSGSLIISMMVLCQKNKKGKTNS